ncbi:MAG: ATP-binding protein [Bacteroidales bacterium]|nr:ATP-binding protein [Bacteroidales bacterium]
MSDLAEYLDCRTTHIFRYSNEIDCLVSRDYVRRACTGGRVSYHVPSDVLDAFKKDQPVPTRSVDNLDLTAFFDKIAEIFDMVEEDEMDVSTAEERINELMECNKHLSFVEKVKGTYHIEGNDLLILLIFCHLFITNSDDRIIFSDIDFMFSKWAMRHIKWAMTNGYSILQNDKLIEWSSDGDFADREHFRLTMNAKRELLDELNLPSLSEKMISRGVIKAGDIKARNLFYSADIANSIDELGQLLEEEHYRNIHARLQDQGFRCGFTCLFYGSPGTGKTETALQLARRTGRDILQVNFAEIKSMWVGESEKNVKALFDSYRHQVKTSVITPILLFNEADAIIGKRQEGAERAVDKMENSIQNIILQEMETLEGILIATTNLAQNMDKAFERRFLYKIRFDKPTVEARAAIWREMLPTLADADAKRLAERYDFSGGQIENIARHYAIDAILHGNAVPTAATLAQHCDMERIDNTTAKRIGFTR